MAASFTKAGEQLIAQKQAAHEVMNISRFVFALVPDLDPESPVDRDAPKPPPEQIVHTQPYTQKGFVNPNQVVYSLMLGSDIGDFDWNWIGLESEEDVLVSVAYVPTQQKRKNILPLQIGNNVTRNMMLAFDGAQELTNVTIDASTWQHDFTVRLHDIDERERLSNRDLFGRACFFGDSLQLVNTDDVYQIKPGIAYLEGIRVELASALPAAVPSLPATAWLDVALVRHASSVEMALSVEWGESLADYADSAGVRHYLIPLAELPDSATITDKRAVEPIAGPLVQHFALRTGDYARLRARATTKEDVGLDQLPNAKSDDPASNSSEILATTAALNNLDQRISDSLVGMVAAFDMESAPPGWLKRNGADVSRIAYAKLFAVIGTRYGAGDGSTTFNVGDSRGLFLRAWDDARGIDPGRSIGTVQQSQNLAHDHGASAAAVGDHIHGAGTDVQGVHFHRAWTDEQGNHQHGIYKALNSAVGVGGPNLTAANGHAGWAAPTDWGGLHSHGVGMDASGGHGHNVSIGGGGNHSHAITVNPTGGNEARPINQALLVCIKY
ncbi:putative tail fiber protein [Pseudomonas syringae pv. tagetis]|uniref:Putative tail fiber protein n=1 Tax=Pseudomonas syringae pv. tagetis TaxID=129140 RepID=A0A3M3YZQ5_9PSED|nr:phage tail protein [Pseudomonas syringae group genomosp. 7]RMO87084.1 putative tail fiber protein [Pseudomonas syringae pv. tagetis]